MLHGEYGGEGKLVSTDKFVLWTYYVLDACKHQGLTFQRESLVPFYTTPVDGFFVAIFEFVIICMEIKEYRGEFAE